MNHNQDIAYNSIKVISNTESYDKRSGSIIINGGIGCKKTIHCKTICAEDSFFNNVTISGSINSINFDNFTANNGIINYLESQEISSNEIESNVINFDKLLPLNENSTIGDENNKVNIFVKNENVENSKIEKLTVKEINIDSFYFDELIPRNYNSQIGNAQYRISLFANKIDSNFGKFNENLYAKIINGEQLNINHNISLTKDYKNKKMIMTDSEESKTQICSDIINIGSTKSSIKINDDGVKLSGLQIMDHVIIDMNSYDKKCIYPQQSLIFLTGSRCHDIILSSQTIENDVNSTVINGTYLKIINLCEINVILNEYILQNNGSYYEFIFIQDKWICLNKGKTKSNNVIKIVEKEHPCICDTEDSTINESSCYNNIDSDDNFSIED